MSFYSIEEVLVLLLAMAMAMAMAIFVLLLKLFTMYSQTSVNQGILLSKLNGLSILVIFIFFIACGPSSPPKKPEKKPERIIKSKINGPTRIAFQFMNASLDTIQPRDIKIELIDRAGALRTPVGIESLRKFKIPEGVLSLGIDSTRAINQENPYVFYMQIDAPGFLTKRQNVILKSKQPRVIPVFMVHEDLPPRGVSIAKDVIKFTENGIVENSFHLSTSATDKKDQDITKATLSIPAGTRLLNADLSGPFSRSAGEATVCLVKFDPLIKEVVNTFPGGFQGLDIINKNGKITSNPSFMTTSGYIDIDIEFKEEKVGGFEGNNPVEVQMETPSGLIDLITGKDIGKGFEMPVWSFNDSLGLWKEEQTIAISSGPDKNPIGTFSLSHLSVWNFGKLVTSCDTTDIVHFEIQNPGGYSARYVTINNSNNQSVTPTNVLNSILLLNEARYNAMTGNTDPGITPLDLVSVPIPNGGHLEFNIHHSLLPPSVSDPSVNPIVARETITSCTGSFAPIVNGRVVPTLELYFQIRCSEPAPYAISNIAALWYVRNSSTTTNISTEFRRFGDFFDSNMVELDMTELNANPGLEYEFTIWLDAINEDSDQLSSSKKIVFTRDNNLSPTSPASPIRQPIISDGTNTATLADDAINIFDISIAGQPRRLISINDIPANINCNTIFLRTQSEQEIIDPDKLAKELDK